ncbi:MAG: peptidase M64 N-terminal domain-containing protein, partial [Candidatus Aminicenantales bacterium]
MKRLLVIAVLAAAVSGCAHAQKGPAFEAWFVDKTLRVDYFHTGSAAAEAFALDQVYDQGIWAGSRTHLIDLFDL